MATRDIKKNRSKKKVNRDKHVLVVFRSNKNILGQVIEPKTNKTLFTVTSNNMDKGTKTEKAIKVGEEIAKELTKKKIKEVTFDRNGYIYHGRIKAMVDAVRDNKIKV